MLRELYDQQPSYEEWKAGAMKIAASPLEAISITDVVMESLSGIDILFLALGVVSAFALALGHYGNR